MKTAKYFAVLADETTDRGLQTQLTILSKVSLLQNKYYFSPMTQLLLPTGQLHQVPWKMFSPLMLSLKILFFIILF